MNLNPRSANGFFSEAMGVSCKRGRQLERGEARRERTRRRDKTRAVRQTRVGDEKRGVTSIESIQSVVFSRWR